MAVRCCADRSTAPTTSSFAVVTRDPEKWSRLVGCRTISTTRLSRRPGLRRPGSPRRASLKRLDGELHRSGSVDATQRVQSHHHAVAGRGRFRRPSVRTGSSSTTTWVPRTVESVTGQKGMAELTTFRLGNPVQRRRRLRHRRRTFPAAGRTAAASRLLLRRSRHTAESTVDRCPCLARGSPMRAGSGPRPAVRAGNCCAHSESVTPQPRCRPVVGGQPAVATRGGR